MDDKELEEERQHRMRREMRIAEMKRQKKRQELLRRRIRTGAGLAGLLICIAAAILFGRKLLRSSGDGRADNVSSSAVNPIETDQALEAGAAEPSEKKSVEKIGAPARIFLTRLAFGGTLQPDSLALELQPYSAVSKLFFDGYRAEIGADTPIITNEEVKSTNAILVDLDTGVVTAQKEALEIVSPASMTKILTLLVAAEHVTDLDAPFTMTLDITDYAYVHKCSTAGFAAEETITVRDLMYGTILPSGGEAALGLAVYVAGSQEAFVDLMNAKLTELGLSETAHFTNCIGLYDEEHHCSLYDMAMILKAAAENDLCREVLSAHIYTTSRTEAHPEGLELSNWFLRKIEDKDTHGEVICAKTGFVDQSGCCGASYAISNNGKHYICVTGNAWSSWRCIYDHVAIYQEYTN